MSEAHNALRDTIRIRWELGVLEKMQQPRDENNRNKPLG